VSGDYRSGLTWYRRDVNSSRHPKVLELLTMRDGFRAYFVWDSSIAYATEHGTDGLIRAHVLPLLQARKVDAARLVKVGLWDEEPDGWRVHGFAEYQQTSQVTEQIRTNRAAAGRKGMCVRWHGAACGCWARPGLRSV
jgi:hypothetical protein